MPRVRQIVKTVAISLCFLGAAFGGVIAVFTVLLFITDIIWLFV